MATRKQESGEVDPADPLGLTAVQRTLLAQAREDAERYALLVRELYHETQTGTLARIRQHVQDQQPVRQPLMLGTDFSKMLM